MRTKEEAANIIEDIARCKEIIKRHMTALDALKAADIGMLGELDDLERIFKKEVFVMEKKINAIKEDEK